MKKITKNNNQPDQIVYIEYNRKSTDEDCGKQIVSIQRQHDDLMEKFPNLYRLSVFQEEKSAFKTDNRPQFDRMIDLIKKGRVQGIIAYSPDRLSRNAYEAGVIVDLISRKLLKDLKFATYTFEDTPEGIMLLQFNLSQSQYSSAKLSRDVKDGNRHAVLVERRWIGQAKPGYLNCQNPITKEKYIDIDPDRFPQLQQAIQLYLTGLYPAVEVLHKLNDEWGYRTRKTKATGDKPLARSSWYEVLSDPFYYGWMVRKEGEVMGTHKPMITEEEYSRIQILLGRRGRAYYRKTDLPYRGMFKCGECGGHIIAEEKWQVVCSNPACKKKFHRGANTIKCPQCGTPIGDSINPKIIHKIYYHCTKKPHRDCKCKGIEITNLEAQIDDILKECTIPEELKEWSLKYLYLVNESELAQQQNITKSINDTEKNIEAKLANLSRLAIDPDNQNGELMSRAEIAAQRKELLRQRDKLLISRKEHHERQDSWYKEASEDYDFACRARYSFAVATDKKEKMALLAGLGQNLKILNKTLLVDEENPHSMIRRLTKKIKDDNLKLEPEKLFDVSGNILYPEPISSLLIPNLDSNQDRQGQNL